MKIIVHNQENNISLRLPGWLVYGRFSIRIAIARLVIGPVVTIVISPSDSIRVLTMKSTAAGCRHPQACPKLRHPAGDAGAASRLPA